MTSAWQPLPDELPSEVRHFVEQLRQLKDATGLSLAALGARTAYSKSSWQRYLNAVQPPPRQAVAALCRVAGLAGPDAERHSVRWELAVEAWPRPAPPPVTDPGATDGPGNAGHTDGPGRPEGARDTGDYEDEPTVPWWDRPQEPAPRPAGRRLLLTAVLLLLFLLVAAVSGAVTSG
ncbi:helix-turn-helix domain-containing protein [Streptomyces sp. NPDC017936]|uniref:helix-turn-helix domain-containing protein n=1 Tax=Streptomyces sp. NPDC017936 TaxID=3365016 RepID=UPI003799360A